MSILSINKFPRTAPPSSRGSPESGMPCLPTPPMHAGLVSSAASIAGFLSVFAGPMVRCAQMPRQRRDVGEGLRRRVFHETLILGIGVAYQHADTSGARGAFHVERGVADIPDRGAG